MSKRDSYTHIEEMKMKGKVQERPEGDPLLDLTLSNNGFDAKSKLELNLSNIGSQSILKSLNNDEDAMIEEKRQFPCKYCNKKFSSSQALGGHQNAHKRERAPLTKEKGLDMFPYGFIDGPINPFLAIRGFPRHGTFNKPLGINMDSMIHKPSYHHSFHHAESAYGPEAGWPRRLMMNQQVTVPNNYYWTTNCAFPIPDTVRYSCLPPFGIFRGSSLANLSAAANRFDRYVNHSRGSISSNHKLDLAGHDSSLNL